MSAILEQIREMGASVSTHANWVRIDLGDDWRGGNEGLALFESVENLKQIVLKNCWYDNKTLARLAELDLPALECLWFTETEITDEGLAHLGRWKSLRNLTLTTGHFTDAGLVHVAALNQLEYLHISEQRITDEGLQYLGGLKHLKELGLTRTAIDGSGFPYLTNLQSLRQLWLYQTFVADDCLDHLQQIPLHSLFLDRTHITDNALEKFASMTKLEGLDVGGTRISDNGLFYLNKALQLTGLGLWSTQIGDAGLRHLKALKNLYSMQLWNTRVTDAGIDEFVEAVPNCEIEFHKPDAAYG